MSPPVLTDVALAVVLGAGLGIGVCLLVSLAPRWGAPSLARRIAPYVRDATEPLGAGSWALRSAGSGVRPLLEGLWLAARTRLGSLLGGSDSVAGRIAQAGWSIDVAAFRGRQLAWALGGILTGGLLVVVLALAGRLSPAAALLAPVLGATALVACDVRLSAAARARSARIAEEFPTVLEFLALCLSAGEGLLDSLRRVGAVGAGELTAEIRAAVIAVGTGGTLQEALTALAQRQRLPALSRTVDHLVAAIDRGAPLAHVLQAQAEDARGDAKRILIEKAGRKEILMLLPLVFAILPLSVVFAVFPGIFMLRLGL